MKNWKKLVTMMACLCLLCGLSGCGSVEGLSQSLEEEKAHAQKLGPLVDDWKETLRHDQLSTFERGVLTRAIDQGAIAQEDYEEGHARYLECMVESGFDQLMYEKMPDGLYSLSEASVTPDGYFDQSIACSEGTTRIVEAYFRDQQDNPQRYQDAGIVAAQCLIDAAIVDDSYTAAQFNKSLEQVYDESQESLRDIFGFEVTGNDKQTLYCLSLGGLGLALDDGA